MDGERDSNGTGFFMGMSMRKNKMRKIKLTQGKTAIVDDDDFEVLNKYKWRFMGRYAVRHQLKGEYTDIKKRGVIAMHTQIMATPKGKLVDHINRDTLYNIKNNLRLCNSSQSNSNRGKHTGASSKYKGVYWDSISLMWRAAIGYNKLVIPLGKFKNERTAFNVYKKKSIELFGEFSAQYANKHLI